MQKEFIRQCFEEAVHTYDSVADVQRIGSEQLVKSISLKNPSSILDIGCGTGYTSLTLYKKYPQSHYTLCDISEAMLKCVQTKFPKHAKILCCDAENYEFPFYDLIVSNLCMQWFSSQNAFIKRILKHCKTFAFSTLLDTSFARYKNMFDQAPTFAYPSIQQLLEGIKAEKYYHTQRYTLIFENFLAVRKYFKKLGAHARSTNTISLKKPSGPIYLDYDILFAIIHTCSP